MTLRSFSLIGLALPALLVASIACSTPSDDDAGGAQEQGDAAPGAQVASVVSIRGRGGLASPGLAPGVFLGPQAPLHAGQEVSTPAGLRAEIALLDGSRVRIDEDSALRLSTADAPMDLSTGRVMLVAGERPITLSSHGETIEIRRGRVQVEASPSARRWSVLAGSATFRSGDREIELATGASLDTPLSPSAPAPQPALSLEPLHSSAWARDFEQAKTLAAGLPPGVGSLTARRPNTNSHSQPLRLAEQRVKVTIRGRVAHTEIEQAFVNDSGRELEGTYRFPLPADASISGLALLVGSRWMEGAMVEKTRARRIFKSIVDRVVPRDPALFEWEQGNVFKLKIFPIPAHGERRVRLSYTQQLESGESGQLRYRYPMGGSGAGATEIGRFDFDVAIDADNLRALPPEAVATPMSRLERREVDGNLYLHRDERNFVPTHELGVDVPAPPATVTTHTDRDGQTYFMMATRPEFATPPPEAVDYVFVADRSHATAPELWNATQGLIGATLEALGPQDRFTVLACDTVCDAATPGLTPATEDTRRRVEDFLRQQSIGGASDIREMLDHASRLLPARSGGTRVIVYLGDGVPTSGELSADGLVRFARSERMTGVRLEAVAMGARADDLVLGALTEATGGDLMHAGISDDLAAVARELQYRARVPALHDVELSLPPGAYDVHPRELPPLRSGEELVVIGKLRTPGLRASEPGTAVLQRRSTSERAELAFPSGIGASTEHPYLPRLWAAEEIQWLTTHRGHEAKDAIVALSQDYTVLSRYTALLALENDAMYRQFAVQRRSREKDSWRGELASGPRQIDWGQGRQPLAMGRSATGTIATDGSAPAQQAVATPSTESGDWDFEGPRREASKRSAAAPSGSSVPTGGAPDADAPEVEAALEAKSALDAAATADARLGGAQGKADANKDLAKEAEREPEEANAWAQAEGAAPIEASLDALEEAGEAEAFGSETQTRWPDAKSEDAPGDLDPWAGPTSAPAASSSASGRGKAARPPRPKAKKSPSRPSKSSGGLVDMAPGGSVGGGSWDDVPMIAKRRPPRPRIRIKAAGSISTQERAELDSLQRLRDADPTDRARHRRLVHRAIRLGDPRVGRWAADWAESDPDHFRALVAHADALAMQGHPMTLRAYESAAEAHPYAKRLHAWLASGLEAAGDFPRACSHRRAIVSIDPSRAQHHADLLTCLTQAGRRDDARQALEVARTRADLRDRATLERSARALETGSLAWQPPRLPRRPAIEAELTFSADADLEVAFIDHRGRRLSAAHAEGGAVGRVEAGQQRLALTRYTRPVYVEVTRRDGGSASVSATLRIETRDGSRRFQLRVGPGTQRVAYVYRR